MTYADAVVWMLRIAAIGIAIDAFEQLSRPSLRRDGGLLAWRVLRHRLDGAPRALRRAADVAFAERIVVAVFAIRLAVLVGVAVWQPGTPAFAAALTLLFASQLYLVVRRAGFGTYASDAMTTIVLAAAWLGVVVDGSPAGMRLALWFVVAQSCLSYFINGAAKLWSRSWRSGRALPMALGTAANGNPVLYRGLSARPRLALVLCWATIVWECAMPLVLVAPEPLRIALLVSGVVFHAAVAWTMGVHLFVWAFAATYPVIWCVTA